MLRDPRLKVVSTNGKDFGEVVSIIVRNDPRYDKGAYDFVRQALDHTLRGVRQRRERHESPHVSGRELLEGIRDFALEQYGPMTLTLFEHWGVRKAEDFGEIVFNLVEYGVFGKTDTDSRTDFQGVYDFHDTFAAPFLPKSRRKRGKKSLR